MNETPKTILITGGSRGIGAATARLAARHGYSVCFSYLNREDDAKKVSADIQQAGQASLAVRCDCADAGQITNLWQAAQDRFGRVDVLVNNAGILEQQQRLVDYDAARIERIFAVNVAGAILCARQAVRHMSTALGGHGGVIVNVSSIAARTGSPNEYIDYAASKAAIDTMTIGLAKEVAGEGIRVCGVRPGLIHTDIHASGGEPGRVDRIAPAIPMQRGGQPDEIAAAILWLAGPEATYVTGSILDVNGGL